MAPFDARRPGPDTQITEAQHAEDSLGGTSHFDTLRTLAQGGISTALVVGALAGSGVLDAATTSAQEVQTSADMSGYPGPESALPTIESQIVGGDESAYPGPAEQNPDQEATVEPSAATPVPPTETPHTVYLPFTLSGRPRAVEPTFTAVAPSETPTEITPTVTETVVASPTTSSTPITPTPTEVTPTPTELPIATETPFVEREMTFVGSELIFTTGDSQGPWGTASDIDIVGKKGSIVGKTAHGVPVIRTQGMTLQLPGYVTDMEGLPIVTMPKRTVTIASDTYPYTTKDLHNMQQDYYIESSYVNVDPSHQLDYTFRGTLGVGASLELHSSISPSPIAHVENLGSSYRLITPSDPEGKDFSLSPDAQYILRVRPNDSGHMVEVIELNNGAEVVKTTSVTDQLSNGTTYLTHRGDVDFKEITFSSEGGVDSYTREGAYESRLNSGIRAKTGVNLGLTDGFGLNAEFTRAHDGVQVLHCQLSSAILDSDGESYLQKYRQMISFAEANKIKANVRVDFTIGSFGTNGTRAVLSYIDAFHSLVADTNADVTIGIIGEDGTIEIDPQVIEALGLPDSGTAGATRLLSYLTGQMGTLDANQTHNIYLGNNIGLAGGNKNSVTTSLKNLASAGNPQIKGVYFTSATLGQTDVKAVADKISKAGYYVGLQPFTDSRSRVTPGSISRLMQSGSIQEVVYAPDYGQNSRSPIGTSQENGIRYRDANSDGAIGGTDFGDLMSLFDSQTTSSPLLPKRGSVEW